MQQVSPELERGGQFDLLLFPNVAPKNCAALLEQLPLEVKAAHSIFSGQALESYLPGLQAVAENPNWFGISPGSVGVEVPIPGRPRSGLGLVIVYGPMFAYRTAFAPLGAPLHVLGQVTGEVPALLAAGQRYHEHGEGWLRLSRKR